MSQTIPQPAPLLPVNQGSDRPLRLVLTIMAFLAALALLTSRMSTRSYQIWQADLSSFATVQIMPNDNKARERTANEALELLSGFNISRLSDDKARALLNPWIGEAPLPDDISLPIIFQVKGTSKAALEAALSAGDMSFTCDCSRSYNRRRLHPSWSI